MKKTDWYYTYVMDLAEEGIINGMTATTYAPANAVTYGQALKLIMMATGYEKLPATGKHWASGFLAAAKRDGLVPSTITESHLDRNISRYDIAKIAVLAMKLPQPTLTETPFTDMPLTNAYAPYVLAFYEAGIISGDDTGKFQGAYAIKRSEMAKIVWNINAYTA